MGQYAVISRVVAGSHDACLHHPTLITEVVRRGRSAEVLVVNLNESSDAQHITKKGTHQEMEAIPPSHLTYNFTRPASDSTSKFVMNLASRPAPNQ
ncbi:unnamed protein product [Prunus armeniaca]|uniref:Uncharacterized protein n=1 Tax=Prunus armeniaca TaxID=36596 RepID=A0A6J5UAB0_PRUAR|nr:unnamed protein product [Prunus armeniaca]